MYGHSNPTIRSTEDGEQVGPKMHAAVRAVGRRVYQSKNELAKAVGPNGSQDYGYRIVNRCLSKSLIKVHPGHEKANPHGAGAVILTDKGARYLNETTDAELDPSEYVDSDAFWSRVKEDWK
jgi:hypothetical protein